MNLYKIAFVFIAILAISCTQNNESNVVINGSVKGLSKGMLYLEKLEDTVLKAVDSVKIDGDPNFTLSTTLDSPEVHYIYVDIEAGNLNDTRLPVFLEAGTITVRTSLNNFIGDAVITGSKNQEKYQEYSRAMERYSAQNLELIKATIQASQVNNDSLANHLKKQQDALMRSKYLATANFAKNNSDYAIAPYLILTEVPEMSVKYMDTVYNSLQDSIKTSLYGKKLQELINSRKSEQ